MQACIEPTIYAGRFGIPHPHKVNNHVRLVALHPFLLRLSITSVTAAHTVWGGVEQVQFLRSGPFHKSRATIIRIGLHNSYRTIFTGMYCQQQTA